MNPLDSLPETLKETLSSDLAGFAAEAAVKVLHANWKAAIPKGDSPNIIVTDLDAAILELAKLRDTLAQKHALSPGEFSAPAQILLHAFYQAHGASTTPEKIRVLRDHFIKEPMMVTVDTEEAELRAIEYYVLSIQLGIPNV